jgi:hypothetical protein
MKNVNSLIQRRIFRDALLPVWFLTAQTIPLAVKCIHLFDWVNNMPAVFFATEQAGSFGFAVSSIGYRSGVPAGAVFFHGCDQCVL